MANLNVKDSSNENSNNTQQINVRVEDNEIELIDKEIKKLENQFPGLKVSRSEMAKILMLRGITNNG